MFWHDQHIITYKLLGVGVVPRYVFNCNLFDFFLWLLADPASQPEIYNSAANDYGVYASPELYGSSGVDDYVLYSSVDDY